MRLQKQLEFSYGLRSAANLDGVRNPTLSYTNLTNEERLPVPSNWAADQRGCVGPRC